MPPKKTTATASEGENEAPFCSDVSKVQKWVDAQKSKNAAVNTTFSSDGKKRSVLYHACRAGNFDVANALVAQHGADVNVRNGGPDKSTALHGACYSGHADCVALLVHSGADVAAKNGFGETPHDNASAPQDGVKKAASTLCVALLKDKTKASKVYNDLVKKLRPDQGEGKTACASAKKERGKDEEKEESPKKAGKKDGDPKTGVASGVHPLAGKTIVFDGTLKVKKNVHKAAIIAAGGKTAGSISSETSAVVTGKNGSNMDVDATNRGITVWSEDDLLHVEKTGTLPVHKNPACFHKLETTKKLDEGARSFLLNALGYRWRKCETSAPGDWMSRILRFHYPQKEGSPCPKVYEYGADVIVPIITEWPGHRLWFADDLISSDVAIVMDAIAARSDKLMPMKYLFILDKQLIHDAGALTIANTLHKTMLEDVRLHHTSITERGIKALLSAVEKMPSAGCLFLFNIAASAKAVVEAWEGGSGKASTWTVRVGQSMC